MTGTIDIDGEGAIEDPGPGPTPPPPIKLGDDSMASFKVMCTSILPEGSTRMVSFQGVEQNVRFSIYLSGVILYKVGQTYECMIG